MPFVADYKRDRRLWDYIVGNPVTDMSIMTGRWYFLMDMLRYTKREDFKIVCRDPASNIWSTWDAYPGKSGNLFTTNPFTLEPAVDVHRSVLANEIVIESDYPTYDENYKAMRIVGAILEKKGFMPHYYYSGNKSIHIHVYLDWDSILLSGKFQRTGISMRFNNSTDRFKSEFLRWLRELMISCWGTRARQFDEDLIRATHLIRAEMSKNKLGYKTFLGWSYLDVPPIPIICNEENGIYPEIGAIQLSRPDDPEKLVSEFFLSMDTSAKKAHNTRKTPPLEGFSPRRPAKLRECVKFILSDEFKGAGDGMSRGMFILVNELTRSFGKDSAVTILMDWNERMGKPIREGDIYYRLSLKEYTLSCDYIHRFLQEIGIDASKKCQGKPYKA